MEKRYKITIPEPCTENWDKMTPNESGRFCMSCVKTVVDFTGMSPDKIQKYIIQNQNSKMCGRFKKSQLDTITIQIPSRVLYSQTHYHKMFLLALFVAMGTTLFSCSDKDGNKQKIDKVEVVEDVSVQEETKGKSLKNSNQIPLPPPSPPKTDLKNCSEKRSLRITMGIVLSSQIEEPFSYDVVYNSNDLDVLPVPKNGMKKFNDFFVKNYAVSNKNDRYQGKILFVVEKDGSLTNFNILENDSKGDAEEVIKVLETAPNWFPGKKKNHIVRSTYILTLPLKM